MSAYNIFNFRLLKVKFELIFSIRQSLPEILRNISVRYGLKFWVFFFILFRLYDSLN